MEVRNYMNKYEFDAIIVGTGPGGATVARELTKKKEKGTYAGKRL